MKKRNGLIDISRFLMSIYIMTGHMNTIGFTDTWPFSANGIVVEFFLILTGWYTAEHYISQRNLVGGG